MTRSKKYILGSILLITVLAVSWALKEYNRKPSTLAHIPADFRLVADKLVNEYELNESLADKKYLGKVLEIQGTVTSVEHETDTLLTVFLGTINSLKKVSCLMDRSLANESKDFKRGDSLVIKGICTGTLMDVELNRCIVVNHKTSN